MDNIWKIVFATFMDYEIPTVKGGSNVPVEHHASIIEEQRVATINFDLVERAEENRSVA